MLEIRKSADRGTRHEDWLDAYYTFSVGSYQDPAQNGFSDLRIINDDRVAPGAGFPTHSHQDVEVFSYVIAGALEHQDSMGQGSVIHPGDVLTMSAGSGITHSEFNHSKTEPLHFFQMWITPDRLGVTPRYQQRHFPETEKRGRLRLLLSPEGAHASLSLYQDARVYAGLFDGSENFVLTLDPHRCAYVHVIRGSVNVNGVTLNSGDGARVHDEPKLLLDAGRDSEVLLFDLRAAS